MTKAQEMLEIADAYEAGLQKMIARSCGRSACQMTKEPQRRRFPCAMDAWSLLTCKAPRYESAPAIETCALCGRTIENIKKQEKDERLL